MENDSSESSTGSVATTETTTETVTESTVESSVETASETQSEVKPSQIEDEKSADLYEKSEVKTNSSGQISEIIKADKEPTIEDTSKMEIMNNPISKNDNIESKSTEKIEEIKGGSYKDVKGNMGKRNETGEQFEVHHMPANSCTELSENEGPAIKMEKEDHKLTASCGYTKEACAYRENQKELIELGMFDEALQMDVDDIHEKFGNKYDKAIEEMQAYYSSIKEEL